MDLLSNDTFCILLVDAPCYWIYEKKSEKLLVVNVLDANVQNIFRYFSTKIVYLIFFAISDISVGVRIKIGYGKT